jgi:hypothetical protein
VGHGPQGLETQRQCLRLRRGIVPIQSQGRFEAGSRHQGGPGCLGPRTQPPPLRPRDPAQSLAQGVAQQMGGICHTPGAPQRAPLPRCPQLSGATGAAGGGHRHRPFQQAAVQLRCAQPWTQDDQGALAEGRGVAVQTIQDQWPTAIHGGGFAYFGIGNRRVGLSQGRQSQLRRGHRGLTLGLVLIECPQFLLKGSSKQWRAVLPQEHKQLGSADALDDGVFRHRQLDWGMPQGWTPGKPSFGNRKKMCVYHATTLWNNTRPMF